MWREQAMSKIQSNKSARRTRKKRNKLNPFAQKVRSAIHYTYNGRGQLTIQGKTPSLSLGGIFSSWK